MDLITRDAFIAREEERYDDALRILERLFERIDAGEVELAGNHFITMFEWSLLVGRYLPAHQALARARDEQLRRLYQGEHHFGDVGEGLPRSRFNVIVEMNEILNDTRSTYDVFVHVASSCPAVARAQAHLALPAIVALGDFILAEAYVGDPLTQLADLNRLSRHLPLYPPLRAAPSLAIELCVFMKSVILRLAVLKGLGRAGQAESVRDAAMTGLATDEMRALCEAELAAPGTIIRDITDRRMAFDALAR